MNSLTVGVSAVAPVTATSCPRALTMLKQGRSDELDTVAAVAVTKTAVMAL
jgi:hypothetical protein